jgi:predicted Holliday junction resolvase-like endonuclease
LVELSRQTTKIEGEKRQLEDDLATLKVDILELQGKLSQNKRDMDTQIRQREVLSQNQRLKGDDIRMKESVLQIKKSTLKNIKNEYQGYLQSIRHLSKIIEGLKRDKLAHEAEVNKREAQQARYTIFA